MVIRLIGYLFGAAVMVGLAAAATVAYIIWDVSQDLPNYEALAKYEPPVTTRLHAADGSMLAEYAREQRLYLPISTIPDLVIQAFLSAEDKSFYEHEGFDLVAITISVQDGSKGWKRQDDWRQVTADGLIPRCVHIGHDEIRMRRG